MHCIHFSYAMGAFICPLVAAPFLKHQSEGGGHGHSVLNGTQVEEVAANNSTDTVHSDEHETQAFSRNEFGWYTW